MTISSSNRIGFFTGDGRLGNQLFQAAFLDGLMSAGDTIYTTGMEEMLEGFDWTRQTIVNRRDSRAHQSAKRWVRRIGRLAAKLRLIDGIAQPRQDFAVNGHLYHAHAGTVVRRKGLIKRYIYIDKGYFQNAALTKQASFHLKAKHLAAAQIFLSNLPNGPKAFVHIRRGDYTAWRIFGRAPVLPLRYFEQGMEAVRAKAPTVQFILLSDDIAGVGEIAGLGETAMGLHVFSGANVYEDFGMMTLCDGGVISNSTLSWWGGFFCRRTLPVISPKGFLAHGLQFEYPVGITADWMTPIEP